MTHVEITDIEARSEVVGPLDPRPRILKDQAGVEVLVLSEGKVGLELWQPVRTCKRCEQRSRY